MQVSTMAIDLARIQFAFTTSVHIIFPALSISLASFVATRKWRWLQTGNKADLNLCRYQLFYMHRRSFDTFAMCENKDVQDAFKEPSEYSIRYQVYGR